jgi:hypothetical protein
MSGGISSMEGVTTARLFAALHNPVAEGTSGAD